jgi:phosphate-selective porin
MRINSLRVAVLTALGVSFAVPAQAGITVYKDGDKYVKIGGRIQMQYHRMDPDNGSASDDLFFRRLRPYIEGSLYKDWKGKFQIDYGKAEGDDEVAVKDAYMQYKGFEGMKVTIGNANFPFSREFLTSSKYQQLIERTFVGDHNYGTPDRNLGIHLTGEASGETITWGASAAQADIDPNAGRVDFDTPVNADPDFNQGWMFGGRVDWHPFGFLKFSQGDFSGETKATIGVAAFTWNNDGDNEANAASLDKVNGYEISGAFRSHGFSVDAEYNRFDVDTTNNNFTGGLYENGETELENWALEGGYMVMPGRLELVAGYQSQDADNYDDEWTRTSVGLNWFLHKHDIKFQTTYRMNDSVDGVNGDDEDEFFVQGQYVF